MKRKFFTNIVAFILVLSTLFSFSACGNKSNMDKFAERLELWAIEDEGFCYSFNNGAEWEEEFDERFDKKVNIISMYTMGDDGGYIIEFKTEKQAKSVTREELVEILSYGYDRFESWSYGREGNIVFFGHPDGIDKIINDN